MLFLLGLFSPRQPMKHFILVDAQERCRAIRQSRERPHDGNWIEVREARLSWLGAPLPAEARVTPVVKHAQGSPALAA